MQITEQQIEAWNEDPELYVDDYNTENCEGTIRVSSNDILTNIGEEFGPKVLLPALSEALARHVSVAEAEKTAQNPHWWKIVEAAATAVGSLKTFICDNQNETQFNLKQYLTFVKTLLGRGGDGSGYQGDVPPYLHGKCLWVLSRFADVSGDIYDRQTLADILNSTASNLSNQKPMAIQISAMRSLLELCQGLEATSEEQRAMVIEKLPRFISFITDIAQRAKNSVLSELLLTISTVIAVSFLQITKKSIIFFIFSYFLFQFDKNFTANNHSKVIPFTIAIFIKYFEDPFILEQVQEILQVLSENEACIGPLQEKLVPSLVSEQSASHWSAKIRFQMAGFSISGEHFELGGSFGT